MTKYFIDTSTLGTIPAQYTETEEGETIVYPGEVKFSYPVEVVFSSTSYFTKFCQNVLLDGNDISYLSYSKDSLKQINIPANVWITNWNNTTFSCCKIVPYQTSLG